MACIRFVCVRNKRYRLLCHTVVSIFLPVIAFSSAECFAKKSRGKADSFNSILGGMAAGAVMAAPSKRLDIMTSAGFWGDC